MSLPSNIPDPESGPDIIDALQSSLEDLPQGPLTYHQIIDGLGARSFGLAIMIIALPMIIPMPPGIPMTAGFIICILAAQLIAGHPKIWLPTSLATKTIEHATLQKAYDVADKYLGWLFKIERPRIPQITSDIWRRLSGFIFLILGGLMILPIPFIGNILPAFACSVLALGLTDRDGIIFAIGVFISTLAIAASVSMALGAIQVLGAIF